MVLSPEEAAKAIRSAQVPGPVRVSGRLDLTNFDREILPPGLHCYELDARGSRLTCLPADIRIDGRLLLDNSPDLTTLPEGLTAGSISLRNCQSLVALPENISTWFLDLTGSQRFEKWPQNGTIHNGSLILRNCIGVRTLPSWLGRLAQLDVSGCAQLEEIPDGIAVTSWVDVGGTRLSSLPPSLQGWVDVGGARLSSLPPSLQGAMLRWRGVPVNERIAFHPEELTATEALAEKNAEVRRVMIERMGYLRFAKEAKAKILDEDKDSGGTRQLLAIDLKEDERLVGLSCICPSTGRQYFLRVPPTMKTCHQAAAWIAGFDDATLYNPKIET